MDLSALFSTFGVPVIVALITTLAVEYLAKPRLEARKARLIRDRQQIDEVVFAFQRAALGCGSLLPDVLIDARPQYRDIQRQQLKVLETAFAGIEVAMGRLPKGFVTRHDDHVRKTSRFVGFMRGTILAELERTPVKLDAIKAMGEELSELDVYFVAHVTIRDSQEWFVRRFYVKHFKATEMAKQSTEVLKRYGLPLE